jgi:hypothetical protein
LAARPAWRRVSLSWQPRQLAGPALPWRPPDERDTRRRPSVGFFVLRIIVHDGGGRDGTHVVGSGRRR